MSSPESYYMKYLKGRNEKQIMTAIRGLKQKMGRLKNTMEDPNYGGVIIMPEECTKLEYTRMYLARAKQALTEIGGTYTPSKAEQKVALFDASIPAISKVTFSIGGFFGGYEKRTITLDVDSLNFDIDYSLILKPSKPPVVQDYPYTKEEFLAGIRELHIGEWRPYYMNLNVLDGTQWELEIEFSNDQKPFKTGGSNAYPYNFNELQELFGIILTEDCEESDGEE